MKTLFLDDNRSRHKKARSNNPSIISVWAAAEAIKAMQDKEWDVVSLDHDLEGEYQDSNEQNTGMEVVRWIVKNKPTVKKFIIHTLNEIARQKMFKALTKAGYETEIKPFILTSLSEL